MGKQKISVEVSEDKPIKARSAGAKVMTDVPSRKAVEGNLNSDLASIPVEVKNPKEEFEKNQETIGSQVAMDSMSQANVVAPINPDLQDPHAHSLFKKRSFIGMIALVAILALGLGVFSFMQLDNSADNVGSISEKEKLTEKNLFSLLEANGIKIKDGDLGINGQLLVNGSIAMNSMEPPAEPFAGQIYYDEDTDQLLWYSNEEWKKLGGGNSAGVSSLQGKTGDVELVAGDGIDINGTTISATNQGTVYKAGQGIAISGDTISNTGVRSLGGAKGSLTLGDGLSISGSTISNDGVLSLTSGSANLVITSDGNGNLTISDTGGGGAAGFVALAPAIADGDNSSNPSIRINDTGGGDLLDLEVGGVDTFRVNNSGLIVEGSIDYSQVTGTPVFVDDVNGLNGSLNLNGTANQVNVSDNGTDTITLSLPQDIDSSASPTFATVDLTSGSLTLGDNLTDGSLSFGDGVSSFLATLSTNNLSANRTYNLPDASGEISLLGQSISNAELDNSTINFGGVSLALGGSDLTPAFNLVDATDLPINTGTTGNLSVSRGGTGTTSFTDNGVLVGNGTSTIQTTAAPTSGQVLIGNGSGVPTFTTLSGDVSVDGAGLTTIANDAITTVKIADGQVTNSKLANSALTVTAGSGLTGGGSTSLGGSSTLNIGAGTGITVNADDIAVDFGSTAGTVAEGNTVLSVSTSGNLSGGTSGTAGGGLSVTLDTVSNPTFSTSVTTPTIQNAGLTLAATGANDLLFETNSTTRMTIDSSGTLFLNGYNCSGNTNGGSLTVTATGEVQCSNDDGGSGGGAPTDSQYLTLALDASLTNERVLNVNTSNLSLTDGGANGNLTIDTIQGISTSSSPNFAGLTLSGDIAVNGGDITSTSGINITASSGDIALSAGTGDISLNTDAVYVDETNSRVGIFDNTPGFALDVTGNIRATGAYRIGSNAGGSISCSADQFVGTAVFSGGLFISGACENDSTGVSDSRLKTNVKSVTSTLDKIKDLRVVTYNWNKTAKEKYKFGDELKYGVIAQELEQVFPELVSDGDDGYKRVNFQGLTFYNLQAVKELSESMQNPKFTSLNVSGTATVNKLVVKESIKTKDLYVNGHIVGNPDTRGTVELAAGETFVEYKFVSKYTEIPVVVVSAVGDPGKRYWVSEVSKEGFKVNIASQSDKSAKFNYIVQQ